MPLINSRTLAEPLIDGVPTLIRLPKKVKPEDVTVDDLKKLSEDSFTLWTQTSGVKMDGNSIDFEEHRYLLPIYNCNDSEIVWRKAAQLGASSWALMKMIWWLRAHPGRKAAMYFPTEQGVQNLSKDRLTPLIKSIHDLKYNEDDKLGLRRIDNSSMYLFHLGGVASKDSVPLDMIAFDEVRLCKPQEIDQALERISHSRFKEKLFLSTCGLPDDTIDRRFKGGTQHIWMSKCSSGCPDGIDLARTFPDCVVDDKKRGKLYLRCPKCKYVIKDTQNGRYVAHNPGAPYHSFSVSQLASKFISLAEIWDMYHRTTNKAEFYNAKLGLPWVDEENRGVTKGQLESCIDPFLEWGKGEKGKRTAMGVDVGGGYCYVTIAELADSKKRIRHVELIESNNPHYMENGRKISPFKRLRQLMKEFNVDLCVVDAMPNYDMVLEFAQEYPGKVFAAWYSKEAKDLVTWSDKPKTKVTIKKAGPLLKFKYYCAINRFTGMDFALGEWAKGNVICPPPDKLVQMCFDENTNQLQPEAPMERAFAMYMRLVKQFHVTNDETGEGRHEWIYSNKDPHFAHSWLYCNIALERLRRSVSWGFA